MTQALARRGRRSRPLPELVGWRRMLILPVIAVEFGLAFAAAMEPKLAFALVLAGAILVVALIKPVPILVLAFPAVFAYWRVGPAAIDMSMTDAFTILGAVAAIPYVPWKNPRLRAMFLLFALYLGAVGVSVLASPSVAAAGEVGHRALMVVGPLMIGSALANLGRARLGLRAFLAMSAFVAAAAIFDTLSSGLGAAYPFGMHKNAVGAHLASGLLVLLAASPRVGLPKSLNIGLAVLLLAGLLATQSRGSALALVAASAFFLLRSRNRRLARLAPLVLVLSLILLTFAIVSFNSSQESTVAEQSNSLNSRVAGYENAITNAWRPHIQFGSGPKWFQAQGIDSGPHNMVIAELSETGLMGLGLLTVFLGGVLVTLWRIRSDLADVAVLVLIERILDSMLGILWVAGTGTLPWLMVGLAVGETDLAEADDHERSTDIVASR